MKIEDLLSEYQSLPEYSGLSLRDVNQLSLFGDRPIHVAATRGAIEELEILLSYGADVNAQGEHGYTPLHNAVEQGKLGAVSWLIHHGADQSRLNSGGKTPRDLALVLGEVEIEKVLSESERSH